MAEPRHQQQHRHHHHHHHHHHHGHAAQPTPAAPPAPAGAASSVEVYGFAGWIASAVAFVAFVAWAVLPESALHAVGITYYPSKHWALAIPLWLVLLVTYIYWAYECLNMMAVPKPSDLSTVHDPRAKWAEIVGLSSVRQSTLACVPPLVHVPVPVACRVLYGRPGTTVGEAERADHKWQIWSTLQSEGPAGGGVGGGGGGTRGEAVGAAAAMAATAATATATAAARGQPSRRSH